MKLNFSVCFNRECDWIFNGKKINFDGCMRCIGSWIFSGVQVILWVAYGGFYSENPVRECNWISVRVSIENVTEFSMLKKWISVAT